MIAAPLVLSPSRRRVLCLCCNICRVWCCAAARMCKMVVCAPERRHALSMVLYNGEEPRQREAKTRAPALGFIKLHFDRGVLQFALRAHAYTTVAHTFSAHACHTPHTHNHAPHTSHRTPHTAHASPETLTQPYCRPVQLRVNRYCPYFYNHVQMIKVMCI